MNTKTCFHCGLNTTSSKIIYDQKSFCCNGCKTVYEIFSENDLTCYYDLQQAPGAKPKDVEGKYHFLDNQKIVEQLLEFNSDTLQIVTLYIPHIHCSSCIWILENLNRLNPAISASIVNFDKKSVRITFNSQSINLKNVVTVLNDIGYEPFISLNDYGIGKKDENRSLIYKLGVAGFAFGNVMFLSFPEYFQVGEFWLEQYKHLFRWLMLIFSLPVVFYSSQDYFISAYKGLQSKILNIDVPIAVGITVLFIRSTVEILFDIGSGFFDSLTGFIFFLLLGKFFQQKTYSFLSFERDYKSYFPIGVTKIFEGKEEPIQVYDIKKGDHLLIRNEELIPVDCIVLNGKANIDYSFVTGESKTVHKQSGDKLFAGGKQLYGNIEVTVLKTVEHGYLTQLWSNDVFKKDKTLAFTNITNSISKNFTIAVLSIAFIATTFWLFRDSSKALNVFTSVLIIACPCAIALAAPFTLGNVLRILGKKKFYLKNASVIEQLSKINTIIFDKTGTITSNKEIKINYDGLQLSGYEESLLKSTLRGSNHPLSRSLYNILNKHDIIIPDTFEEHIGKGIEAKYKDKNIKIGAASFVGHNTDVATLNTTVHVSTNNQYKGKFTFYNKYRKGLSQLFNKLKKEYDLVILSGDNEGEKENLSKLLPTKTKLLFNHKPEEKLDYIKYHQTEGAHILMIGDGLNDAGALAQSNVGVAISENVTIFSPACDAILDASKFNQLHNYLNVSKKAIKIIKWSFLLSFFYNIIGLYFAVTGQLTPVIAAILMPLSSISIVTFTSICSTIICRKLK